MALDCFEDYIKDLVESQNFTHQQVSDCLKASFGVQRGFSAKNIETFCRKKNIHKYDFGVMSVNEIDSAIECAVSEVGPAYGRRMLTGLLRSRGYRIGERAVRQSLLRRTPFYQAQRRSGAERLLNPSPYFAEYAGHKIHMDQNEKLAAFGVTHVIASDGFSGKIVGAASMPVKNNVIIYDEVYRSACLTYGLWDQVRVDHGTEFFLTLYQQDKIAHLRTNTNRTPFFQTQSKQNHTAERVWVEINQRCNYPMKKALLELKNEDLIDMDDNIIKFCVSEFCLLVIKLSIQNMIDAWNARTIPGKGIPNQRFLQSNRCAQVSPVNFPQGSDLVIEYTQLGGTLTVEPSFGEDPFENSHQRIIRDQQFALQYPSLAVINSRLVNGQGESFQHALLDFINITMQCMP